MSFILQSFYRIIQRNVNTGKYTQKPVGVLGVKLPGNGRIYKRNLLQSESQQQLSAFHEPVEHKCDSI